MHDRHLVVGWEQQDEDDPDATTKKGGDQREMVYQDKHLHVHRHQTEHIEGNKMQMIGKGDAEDGGNLQIYIEKDKVQTVEGNYLMHVLQDAGRDDRRSDLTDHEQQRDHAHQGEQPYEGARREAREDRRAPCR